MRSTDAATVLGTVLACGIVCFLWSGCVAVTNAASPTALEEQLLGEYEALDRELVEAASVRGPAEQRTSYEAVEALAISSRALQKFNEDDLDELIRNGCIEEAPGGMVEARQCSATSDETVARRLQRVVREENNARGHILRWAAYSMARKDGRKFPTEAEESEVRAAYHRLRVEALRTAPPGEAERSTP
jgi:hypothetical protein